MPFPTLPGPAWPADHQRDVPWRRLGLPFFILLSLVLHGLGWHLKFQFSPKFPVDREKPPFRLELKIAHIKPPHQPAPASSPVAAKARASSQAPSPAPSSATAPTTVTSLRPSPIEPATDLADRAKTELRAASQRQMLDPMFAPVARPASGITPFERATAATDRKIEQRGAHIIRVTNADGSQYCLQRLPEVATRDIPTPLVGVPMKCQ